MERREFLKTQGGLLAAGMLTIGGGIAEAAGPVVKGDAIVIDSAKLADQAYATFIPGKKSCGESMLAAGCGALGIESDLIPGIALGLAGGVGLQGKTCGVLTGSAMVMSLAYAHIDDYATRKKQTMQAVGRIVKAFEAQFGSTDCRTLSGLDLTKPEDRKILKNKVKAETCAKYVKAGAAIMAEELKRCGEQA